MCHRYVHSNSVRDGICEEEKSKGRYGVAVDMHQELGMRPQKEQMYGTWVL